MADDKKKQSGLVDSTNWSAEAKSGLIKFDLDNKQYYTKGSASMMGQSVSGDVADQYNLINRREKPFGSAEVTNNEKEKFFALYNESPSKANAYAQRLNRYYQGGENDAIQAWAGKNPVNRVIANVGSLAAMPVQAGMGLAETANAIIKPNDPYRETYLNSYLNPGSLSSNLRAGARYEGEVLGTLDDIVYTTAQSLIAQGMTGGMGSLLLSGNVLESSYRENRNAGMTSEQAMVTSAVMAGISYITEHMGTDQVFDKMSRLAPLNAGTKTVVASTVKQLLSAFLSEGIEEGAEGLLDNAAEVILDRLYGTDYSTFATKKAELIAKGMSDDEATKQAIYSIAQEIGKEMLMGGASGLLGGGAVSVASNIRRNAVNNRMYNQAVENNRLGGESGLINTLRNSTDADVSAMAQNLNENSKKRDIGKAINVQMGAIERDAIATSLSNRGMETQQAQNLAEAIRADNAHEILTNEQRELLKQNKDVVKSINNDIKREAPWVQRMYATQGAFYEGFDSKTNDTVAETVTEPKAEEKPSTHILTKDELNFKKAFGLSLGANEAMPDNKSEQEVTPDELIASYAKSNDMDVKALTAGYENARGQIPNLSANRYANSLDLAYEYGRMRESLEKLTKALPIPVDENVSKRYEQGLQDSIKARSEAVVKATIRKQGYTFLNDGNARFATNEDITAAKLNYAETITDKELTDKQRAIINFWTQFYKGTKYRLLFYATELQNGSQAGVFTHINGQPVVMLDVNEPMLLRKGVHEFVHTLRNDNPALYEELKQYIKDKFYQDKDIVKEAREQKAREDYANAQAQVRQGKIKTIAEYKSNLDPDSAEEEIIARHCENVFDDIEAVSEIYQRKPGLWNAIKGFFDKFLAKLKEVIAGYGRNDNKYAEELAQDIDAVERVRSILLKGREMAINNETQQEIVENSIPVDVSTDTVQGEDTKVANMSVADEMEDLTEIDMLAPYSVEWDRGILMDGEDTPIMYSTRAGIEALGFGYDITENDGLKMLNIKTADGKLVDKDTPVSTIRSIIGRQDSPLNRLIDMSKSKGIIGEDEQNAFYDATAEFIHTALKYGQDPVSGKDKLDAIWKWAGSDVFRAIKPNSDKQYGTSNDMQTVCKKTEQVLDSISEYQVKAKRGVSPGEVMRIYLETGKNGYQTPCPFCYVFSHWIRMGLLYETAASAEDHYMAKLKEKNGISDLEWWKKEYAKQKEFADKNSKAIADAKADLEDIERMIDQFARPLSDAVRNNDTEAVNRIQEIVDRLNTRYIAAYKLASASDYAGWIKNCILNIPRSGLKDATAYGDYKLVNRDILFDFRRADELVRDYPALARFRTSKGSAGGKAVENYADNKFGEVIAGVATDGERDADNKLLNYFNGNGTKEEFERQFDSARKRIAKQNLRGGQRFFSWSDNRIDTGIDMLFNFIQFSALGSAVQSYTKQIEGLELIASVGGYCNASLVGKGIGFRNAKYDKNGKVISGELVFSKIQGIDAETTFELNRRYDKAGNILVGMNDTHIALALGDNRIFFVIPWHRSGLSNDLLFRMMAMLGEEYVSEGKGSDSDATDYSNYQEEKSYSKHMDGTLEKYKGIPTTVTDLFKKIEGMSAQGQTARDIRGFDRVTVENGKLSDSQIAYRKLRAKVMTGKSLTEEEKQWVIGDEYLTRLQDSMRRNEIESWGTDDIDSIYPYEYWDTNTTYANADRNGIRYLEYCRRLGVQPKFCGINNTGDVKGVADFTEIPGYWKVLVDRRMYDTKGRYQGLTPISLVNKGSTQRGFLNELITPEGIKAREEEYAKMGLDYKVTRLADAVGARKIADRVRTSMGDLYNIDRASDGETALAEYKAAVEDVDLNKVAPQSKFSTRDLSYNTLVSKPNMPIVQIKGNVPTTRDDVVSQAKENAKRIGKVDSRGSVSVYISDINSDVILSSKGLRHGLDRRFSELAPVVLNAGEILKNSILINELYSRDPANIDYGMVLIGVAQGSPNDGLRLVESVVNRYTHDLVSMDVLYSINAKKNSTAVLNAPRGTTPSYRTDISIAELLDLVNNYFPDVLPMDVLNHFGQTARPQGELGKSAKFSTRDYFDTEETKTITEDPKAGPLVNTLINTIKGAGNTFSPKAFYDFYTENPEYDFVVRIQEGDGNAAFELADILAKMDSAEMVDDLKWYAVESHPLYRDLHTGKDLRNSKGDIATFAQTHRKGIREFRRLCDERIEQLKSETAHGENLGIKNMTDMPMNEVKDLFDRLNSNADIQKLADKVFGVAKDLNLAVVFSNGAFSGTNRVGYYHGNRSLTTGRNGLVALKTSLFNDRGTTNQQKATVILHEMIHAVTSSLLYTPALKRTHFDVSVKTQNAIDAINGLYRRLIRSTATSKFKSTYGLTNVHEFVAELANPQFRDELANAQVGDINPYVESLRYIGDLVGLDGSANLRDNTLAVLDNFIDNFYGDIDTYREMSAKRMYSGNSNVPKYSIRYNEDGSVTVDGISAFSGGGTIDYMLGDMVSHIFAAEYDEQIAAVYETNNGIKAHRDILDDKTLEELKNIKESIEYAHFSPVCTNVSLANNNRGETARDIEFAHKVVEWIEAKKPLSITVENVPQYATTQSAKIIMDALKRNGYDYKAGVYNSIDFGGDMSRDRFFVRALLHGKVPEVVKTGRTTKGWYNAVKDLIPSLNQSETSKQAMNKGAEYTKNYIPAWMKERLDAMKINYKNPSKPLFVMGTGDANGLVRVYEADQPIGSVKAKVGEPKIILTNGRVLDVSPAVIARLMGIPDSFELPSAKTRAFKILGNGVPGQLSRAMAVPLINEVIEQDREKRNESQVRYSTRDNPINLNGDSELLQRVDGIYGSRRYKIVANYILEQLGEQVVLSDGQVALVNHRDASHISARSYDRRTRELARITELVRSARYYAYEDAEHDNFNFFKYYEVFVRLGKETYPLYLNVGRKINPAGEYHLYDITEKIRESAHRLNGVGRVPKGTYALETDSQKNLTSGNHLEQVLDDNRISQNATEVNPQTQKNSTRLGEDLTPLKTLNGSVIKRSRYGVGKDIGGQIYLHKNYATDVIPADVWEKALSIVPKDFAYNTVMYDSKKPNEVRFDEAPDFDTAREPHPGQMLKVNVTDETATPAKGNGNMIWHHKWLWVKNDYTGFDVEESYNWSKRWLEKISNPSGSLRVWNEALEKNGLPLDSVTRYSTREQEYTSEDTSLNQTPSTFTNYQFSSNDRILDWGGGRYDAAKTAMESVYPGITFEIVDPFNRTESHNDRIKAEFKKNPATVLTINNVLNVIKEASVRESVLRESKEYLAKDGIAYILIHPGTTEQQKAGGGETTKGWQNAKPASWYEPEVKKVYKNTKVVGQLILASDGEINYKKIDAETKAKIDVAKVEAKSQRLDMKESLYSTRTELSNYEILAETLESNLQSQADKDALKMYKASYNEALKIRARLDELNTLLREETHPAVQHNYQTQINELRKSLRKREEILDKVLTKPRIASLVAKQKADIQKLEGYLMDEQMTHQEDVEALRKRLGKLGDKIVQQNERFRAYRARMAENKGINYYRPRIEKVAKSLSEQLNTTLPIPFRQPIAGVLSLLDFTTKKDGSVRTGKANFDRQVAQAQFAKMAQDASDPYKFFSEYGIDISPDFADWVREIQQWFADATSGMTTMDVRAMDSYQLQSLYRFLKNIDTQAKKATKMYQAKATSVKELGENTMIHLEPLAVKEQGKLQGVTDFLTWENAQPVTAFDRFGESGKKLFEAFADSQDQLAWDNKAIREFTEKLFEGKDIASWRSETQTVKIGDEEVTAPIAFWMEMYCYLNQEDSYRHLIEGGGFRMKDYKEKGKTITDTDRFMTEEDLIAIENALTPEQKEVATALKQYMAETGSEWGNAISRVRFGIDQFGSIKDYYPIKTIRSETQEAKMKEEDGGNLYALMNKSWTKGRVMNAKNALVVGDIFETFAKHMGEMATYHSFALSTLDTIKWLNYKSNELSDDDKIREKSVQGAMKQAYGNAAPKYIFDFLDSVNGTAQAKDDTFALRFVSAKNRVAVGANFRVMIQQPLSLARAFSEISPKYFSLFNYKQTYDEMMQYGGIAEWKANGHYETNISRSLLDQIAPDKNTARAKKITDITMKGAELGDTIAWTTLWNACKNEVKEQNPQLTGEALMDKVNKRFRDIVYRTQVVDSTLTRSAYMRKKDYFHRITSSFKSEPTATLNMLVRAVDAFRYDTRRYGKAQAWARNKSVITTTLAAFALTQILNAAVTAIVDAFRDDDDYETWIEKWYQAFKGSVAENFIVLNSVPYVADLFSLLAGYTPSRPDMEVVSSLISTAKQTWSAIQRGSMTPKNIFNLVTTAAYATGLPIQNVMRDVIGFYNGTIGILYDLKITDSTSAKFQMSPETNKSGYTAFYSALKENRTERAMSLLTEMADNDLDAKKIYNGTYNLVKEDYQAGRISKEDALKYVRMIVEFTGIERTDKQINDLVDGW